MLKRIFDVSLASCILVIISPILLIIAFLVKVSSQGPVIFKLARVGLNEKEFMLLKFRTMRLNAPLTRSDNLEKKYVTPIGNVLRKCSFDELPQLLNVIKGEMSLIGPRPIDPIIDQERHKLNIKEGMYHVLPGITGLAQVKLDRSKMTDAEIINLNKEYMHNKSFLLDVKIIFLTIKKILLLKNQ